MNNNANKKIKAIDFFSGAGGLTYGLRSAGIDVLAGVDIEPTCKETYEKNNKGSVYLEKDVTKYCSAFNKITGNC